jgi:hypothetical protein
MKKARDITQPYWADNIYFENFLAMTYGGVDITNIHIFFSLYV